MKNIFFLSFRWAHYIILLSVMTQINKTGKINADGTLNVKSEWIKELEKLACYHNRAQLVIKELNQYDHLSVMGFTRALVCNVCKKRIGIK